MILECSSGDITDTSIQITWNNEYPECFRFRVFLNGTAIQIEMADQDYYSIINLRPSTPYNVCVVAYDGHGSTQSVDCDMLSTLALVSVTIDVDVDVDVNVGADANATATPTPPGVCILSVDWY